MSRLPRTIGAARRERRRGLRQVRLIGTLTAALIGASGASGCCTVTLYEPQRGLQQPTLIQAGTGQLAGTRVRISCAASADLPAGDAYRVCRNVGRTLEHQGATVETSLARSTSEDAEASDLTVELTSRLEHRFDHPALGVAAVLSCLMIPLMEEETWSYDVTVRGRDGSVLATESLGARFVTYLGPVVWSINWLLDAGFRSDADDLGGDAPKRDFSRDFYRHVAQVTYNARARAELLGMTARAPVPGAPLTDKGPAPAPAAATPPAATPPAATPPAATPPAATPPAATPPAATPPAASPAPSSATAPDAAASSVDPSDAAAAPGQVF